MAEKSKSIDRCLILIADLEEKLATANRAMLMGGDNRVVNIKEMNEYLQWLREALPESIRNAETVLQDEKAVLDRANAKAAEIVANAQQVAEQEKARVNSELMNTQQRLAQTRNQLATAHEDAAREAKQTLANAQAQAEQMLRQAQQQGEAIVQQANAQAQQIFQQANAQAQQMVAQENVYMRAQVDAERLRSETEEQMRTLRHNTFNFMDNMLSQLEQYTGAIMADVHQERESLSGHR